MKIPTKGPSRFLSQEDLATPIVAVMSHVTRERLKGPRGEDDRFILHFQAVNGVAPKPLKLNVTNSRILIAAYGDESESWRGQPIEIYHDPNVTMGGELVGGLRLRIPAARIAPNTSPPPAAAPAAQPQKTQPSLQQRHASVLAGYAHAATVQRLDQVQRWSEQHPFTPQQRQQQQDLYHERLAELAPGEHDYSEEGAA